MISIKRRNRTAVVLIVVATLLVVVAILSRDSRNVSMCSTLVAIVLIIVAHGLARKPSGAKSTSKQRGILKRGPSQAPKSLYT